MKPPFVDTSGWCAIYNRADVNHIQARTCWEKISQKVGLVYTTDYVLDETITLLRARVGHKPAVEFGQVILASKVVKTVPITQELWQKAWEMFIRYDDKDFSFTECTSFVVMKEMQLTTALAFDHHFTQMGFLTLPENRIAAVQELETPQENNPY